MYFIKPCLFVIIVIQANVLPIVQSLGVIPSNTADSHGLCFDVYDSTLGLAWPAPPVNDVDKHVIHIVHCMHEVNRDIAFSRDPTNWNHRMAFHAKHCVAILRKIYVFIQNNPEYNTPPHPLLCQDIIDTAFGEELDLPAPTQKKWTKLKVVHDEHNQPSKKPTSGTLTPQSYFETLKGTISQKLEKFYMQSDLYERIGAENFGNMLLKEFARIGLTSEERAWLELARSPTVMRIGAFGVSCWFKSPGAAMHAIRTVLVDYDAINLNTTAKKTMET